MRNLLIVLSFSIATTLLASAEQFKVPATTKLGFSIMKFKIQDAVQGKFGALNGTYKFDAATNKLVDINVTIDVNSIDTSDEKRDGHLKTDPDFFNTAKFDKITFKMGDAVTVKEGKPVKVTGNLTIKDVTAPVTMMLTYKGMKNGQPSFEADGALDRQKFKVSWNKPVEDKGLFETLKAKFKNFAGNIIGDEVKFTINM